MGGNRSRKVQTQKPFKGKRFAKKAVTVRGIHFPSMSEAMQYLAEEYMRKHGIVDKASVPYDVRRSIADEIGTHPGHATHFFNSTANYGRIKKWLEKARFDNVMPLKIVTNQVRKKGKGNPHIIESNGELIFNSKKDGILSIFDLFGDKSIPDEAIALLIGCNDIYVNDIRRERKLKNLKSSLADASAKVKSEYIKTIKKSLMPLKHEGPVESSKKEEKPVTEGSTVKIVQSISEVLSSIKNVMGAETPMRIEIKPDGTQVVICN